MQGDKAGEDAATRVSKHEDATEIEKVRLISLLSVRARKKFPFIMLLACYRHALFDSCMPAAGQWG